MASLQPEKTAAELVAEVSHFRGDYKWPSVDAAVFETLEALTRELAEVRNEVSWLREGLRTLDAMMRRDSV